MKQIRLTAKLKKAIEILSEDGGMADCSDKAFIIAMQKRKFTPQALYKIMAAMRYQWDPQRGYWRWKPRELKAVKRVFKIVRVIDDELKAGEL